MRLAHLVPVIAFLACAPTFAATLEPMALIDEGYQLSTLAAERLEVALQRKPDDEPARIKLLGYYATQPTSLDPQTTRQRRAKHIFWLIENHPKCPLFEYVGGAWRIYLKGDALADPVAFQQGKTIWLRQIKSHPNDEKIKQYASTFLQFGDPETAANLLRELKLNRAVGSHYAYQFLGIVAHDYKTGDPSAIDESLRDSDYGKRIQAELQATHDPQLAGGAGFWLAVQGGMLYADGKTSWDYSKVSEALLAKARRLDPDTLDWWAISTALTCPR